MYNISDVYEAFEKCGQNEVAIDFKDRFKVTMDEIRLACTTALIDDVIVTLDFITNARPMQELRSTRDSLLNKTDWVVTKSNETGEPIPEEWKAYRQALRDITNHYSSLEEVVWPSKPQ